MSWKKVRNHEMHWRCWLLGHHGIDLDGEFGWCWKCGLVKLEDSD